MLKSDITKDIKIKQIERGVTNRALAEKLEVTDKYIGRVINNGEKLIDRRLIKIMDILGYDIEITYTKQEERK